MTRETEENTSALALAAWLKKMMQESDTKNVDLAEALGKTGVQVSLPYISNLRRIGMSMQRATEIAEVMGWEKPQLKMTSEGLTALTEDNSLSNSPTSIVISTLTPQAGTLAHNNDYEILEQVRVPTHWLKATYPNLANINNLALCNIRGDSMEPTFDQEDTILVDRSTVTFDTDGVYVFTYHDTLLIKRVQRRPGRGYIVISDNREFYEAYEIPMEDLANVNVHGRVVGKFGFVKI